MIDSAQIQMLLLQRRAAPIEGFGWIEVDHHPAYLLAPQQIEPPHRTLRVTADPYATQYYYQPIVIDGVGIIYPESLSIEIDPTFESLLNPVEHHRGHLARVPAPVVTPRSLEIDHSIHQPEPRAQRRIRVRPVSRNPHNYTTSVVAVLVVLAAVGYILYYLYINSILELPTWK